MTSSDVTTEKRIHLFLHYIACGGYYYQLGRSDRNAKSTAFYYLHDAAHFFCSIADNYIQLPGLNKLPQLAQPLPDGQMVILYIDGFIVHVQRPDNAGDAYFRGRHGKSCDSINV